MDNLPSTSFQDVPSPHDVNAQAHTPVKPDDIHRLATWLDQSGRDYFSAFMHAHSSGRPLDEESRFLLELCGLEQALSAHPRDYGTIHPTIHSCRGGPSEQWLIQGMRDVADPATAMLRLSALIAFEKLAGGDKAELPTQTRRWGHLHNFSMILEEGRATGTRYCTYWQMGCRILQVADGSLQPIFVHPIFHQAPAQSVWFWLDIQYWSARLEGRRHDEIWPEFHRLLEDGLRELGVELDSKCGCPLSGS